MFNECFGNTLTQKIDYKLHQLRRCDDDDDVENRMWNERREREEQEGGMRNKSVCEMILFSVAFFCVFLHRSLM